MTTTLADLRRLLEGSLSRGGPAIDREPEDNHSVRGLAAVYLGDDIASMLGADPVAGEARWAVAPRRNHALLVALALYLGVDPGAMGLGVAMVLFGDGWYLFGERPNGAGPWLSKIAGAAVAAEPHPVKALALAVAHVLA